MTSISNTINIYLETGSKRTFAGALDWPGWCRSGRDESSAESALLAYAPRYAIVLQIIGIRLLAPLAASEFCIMESLVGNTSTDYGTLGIAPAYDIQPIDDSELHRLLDILNACWLALDTTVYAAQGNELRKGPRGGGRDLKSIQRHILEAEQAYLAKLGFLSNLNVKNTITEQQSHIREFVREVLASAAHLTEPGLGPRGGTRWMPRYFARKVAWHVLDHAWEIEDRSSSCEI